jgi:hypothetical protein
MTGDLNVGGGGNGSLFLDNGGSVTAPFGVSVSGVGALGGNGSINTNNLVNSGTVHPGPATTPGLAASTLNIGGNYIQTSTGKLNFDLDTGDHGRLIVNGDVTLNGEINVDWFYNLPFWTPTVGQSFTLMSWSGTRSGSFTTVDLPDFSPGFDWSLQYLSNAVLLVAAAPGPPGDFNNDGDVDAADYAVWRKGIGTNFTQNDYDVWRAHFGQTVGSGAASSDANSPLCSVPEPSTVMLLILAAASALNRRDRVPGQCCQFDVVAPSMVHFAGLC